MQIIIKKEKNVMPFINIVKCAYNNFDNVKVLAGRIIIRTTTYEHKLIKDVLDNFMINYEVE